MERPALLTALDAVSAAFPQDAGTARELRALMAGGRDVTDRRNMAGHARACGYVLSPALDEILLVHHRVLGDWIQPGGHLEASDADPLDGALREIREETSLAALEALDWDGRGGKTPFMFARRDVPANPAKGEAAHPHYDFRYAFVAGTRATAGQDEEVSDVRWFPLDALPPGQRDLIESVERLRQLIPR